MQINITFIRTMIVTLLMIILTACDDSHSTIDISEDKYEIKVYSHTVNRATNDTIPDIGTNVYIYFGYFSVDLANYELLENGVLINKNTNHKIMPTTHGTINEYGKFEVEFESIDPKITILISNPNTLQSVADSFLNTNKKITMKNYFIR